MWQNAKTKEYFICCGILQSYWQVSHSHYLPQARLGKPDTTAIVCVLLPSETENLHPARGKLPQRDDYESNTLSGMAQTFWHTTPVRETFLMCICAPLPAELPLHWHGFPFHGTSVHKVWCNIIENVYVFIRGYSIKYAGTLKWISDCDSRQWLNACQRFMMNSGVSSFQRQHPFFYRHLLLVDLFFISVTNLYTHRVRLLVCCCLNAMHLRALQNFLTKSLLGPLTLQNNPNGCRD